MSIGRMISETVVYPVAFFPRLFFIFLSVSLSTLGNYKILQIKLQVEHVCSSSLELYRASKKMSFSTTNSAQRFRAQVEPI